MTEADDTVSGGRYFVEARLFSGFWAVVVEFTEHGVWCIPSASARLPMPSASARLPMQRLFFPYSAVNGIGDYGIPQQEDRHE